MLHISKILFTILLFISFHLSSAGSVSDSLLNSLDKMLPERNSYSQQRRENISSLKSKIQSDLSDEDMYNIFRSLYGEYRSYRNDSALAIASQRLDVARKIGAPDKVISASINMADAYSSCGNYYRAIETLDTLNRSLMRPYHLKYLYKVYGSTFSRLAEDETVNSGKVEMSKKVIAYRDSSSSMFSPNDAEFCYLKVWQLMDNSYWKEALNLMDNTRENFGDNLDNPAILTQRAIIYHNLGMKELEKECLTRAAICDISDGNKDYASLLSLSLLLNSEGDSQRAYNYITSALEDASFSNAKSRINQILRALPIIYKGFEDARKSKQNAFVGFVILLSAFIVVLVVVLYVTRRQLLKIRRIKSSLDEKNCQLNKIVALLNEANGVQRGNIYDLFDAYSRFINRMTTFRKSILRLIKVAKYQEASDLAASNKIEAEELKELYVRFDKMFLLSFPDFIKQFNSFVKDEEKVDAKATTLTSLLRVVALMKLGVSSTKQIESMLHYTSQTVYNYKNRLKTGLAVPFEEFQQWLNA